MLQLIGNTFHIRGRLSNLQTRKSICVAILLWLAAPSLASGRSVVVLTSDSLTSTVRTVSGLTGTVKKTHSDISFIQINCHPSNTQLEQQLIDARAAHPFVIATVGTSATERAQKEFPSTPIVFAAVLYPHLSGFEVAARKGGQPITGASLDIPYHIQFRHFKQIVPSLKRIGLLYTVNTESLAKAAVKAAADSGLQLIAIKLLSERDLPNAVDSLSRSCQGIWSLADQSVFTPQATRYILINTLRHGIPVMGFSRNVVESGALFALDFDYKAVGRQAGDMVAAILSGTSPTSLGVTVPDIIWFHYNEKTAAHLHVTIPPELIAVAKEVYR